MDKTPILIHPWEVARTAGDGIDEEALRNKIIDLKLRSLNNLIKVNWNNEVYTDLQLDDNLLSTATLPVGVTTGRVLQANGRPVTWTLILAKTTSGDDVKILYGDDWKIRVDNGTGTWKILAYADDMKLASFVTRSEYQQLPASKTTDGNLYIIVRRHPWGWWGI